ncbi:MAG: AAA family ATPase [bacterium]
MRKKNVLLNVGPKITVIAITGGPCAGKTTGLAYLYQKLRDRGYKVLISPESATKLITAGMTPGELSNSIFQEEILLDVVAQEERMISIAKRYAKIGKRVVVLCDRGVMDGEAYAGKAAFARLLKKHSLNHHTACNSRYHAVIHLRTAALGAEKFYTLENNSARIEGHDRAIQVDEATLDAWTRHHHPRVIDNSTDFDGKIHRLFEEVCWILGDPVPLEKEDKFLIKSIRDKDIPVTWFKSLVTQFYLKSNDDSVRRIRSRADIDNGETTFYYTIKREVEPGVRSEVERMISEREFKRLLMERDPDFDPITKERICFFWKNQFFELDRFFGQNRGLYLMEAEQTNLSPEISLPPFVKVTKKVTADKNYGNYQLARKK